MASEAAQDTGTSNELYNLVSVLYHALQGAETLGQYLESIEDEKLGVEFEKFQKQYRAIGERAKELLRARLAESSSSSGKGSKQKRIPRPDAQDEVDEASIESFPASDSPAY